MTDVYTTALFPTKASSDDEGTKHHYYLLRASQQ